MDWGKIRTAQRQAMAGARPHEVRLDWTTTRQAHKAADVDTSDLHDPYMMDRIHGFIPENWDPNMAPLADIDIPDWVMPEDLDDYLNRNALVMKYPEPEKPKAHKTPKHPENPEPKHRHEWFAEEVTECVPIYKEDWGSYWSRPLDTTVKVWRDQANKTTRTRLCLGCGKEEVTSVTWDDERMLTRSGWWRRTTWREGNYDEIAAIYKRNKRHHEEWIRRGWGQNENYYVTYDSMFPKEIIYMN